MRRKRNHHGGRPEPGRRVERAAAASFSNTARLQCGYCTPGMLMAATALLRRNPRPSLEEIKIGLDGNLCRCTGYTGIFEAIQACAQGKAERN